MADDQVRADYERARRKAFLHDVVSFFRRQPNTLISYADVRDRVTMEGESYRGMQEVPVDRIVGSVDRFRDFDRSFLPKRKNTANRWKSIDRAYHQDVVLPPIQLYKVGDIYFVKDGNHRVSVAREHGVNFLVLDEPTASLDEPSRRALWRLLGGLPEETTALLVTHDLAPDTFAPSRAVLVDRGLEELAIDGLHQHPAVCGHTHG